MMDFRGRARPFAVHAALAAASAVSLAVGDALVASRGNGHAGLSAWIAVGSAAPVAAAWGVVQNPVFSAFMKLLERLGIVERWNRYQSSDRAGPREPTVLAHTVLLLGVLFTGLLLVSVWVVRNALRTIQDDRLQAVLLTVALGLLVIGLAVALVLLTPPVSRLLTGFDERFGLPWPRPPLLRFVFGVFLPTALLVLFLGVRYADDLGNVLLPFEFVVFAELEIVLFLFARSVAPERLNRLVAGGLGISLVVAAAQPITFSRVKAAKAVSQRGTFVPRAVGVLRRATDFDRDGFSGLYAGGDCAPLDRRINPQAEDLPGNGTDENCDGSDALPTSAGARGPLFSSALPRALVRKYSIVWIVVDALRPDSMNLYGSRRKNTPALNELSRVAIQFDQAFAPSSTTHLSIPCMLAGRNADRATWEYRDDKSRVHLVEKTVTLAQRLKPLGYRTAAIISPHIHQLKTALAGFDKILTTSSFRHSPSHSASVSTALGIDFLQRDPGYLSGQQPFFLFVYYEDPHKPYEKHGPRFPDYGKGDKERYDGEIAYTDAYVGSLLDHLELHGKAWDNTLVIVTSDHGEEFKEHGSWSHGRTCYEESAHVPLLFRIPGMGGKEVKRRVSLVDIPPTILELIGATADPGELDGQSLLVAARDEGIPPPSFCAIMNQGGNAGTPYFVRSVRFGPRGLIHHVLGDQFELYDETADQAETTNIVASPAEAATVEKLKRLLSANATGNLYQQRLQ